MKERNIPVVIGNVLTTPLREDASHAANYQLAGELAKAGVKFAFATSDAAYARNLPYHAAMSVAWGLDRQEALKALTINAAQILGVADRIGSLEAGKDANLFIVQGGSARGPNAGDAGRHRRARRRPRQQAARAVSEVSGKAIAGDHGMSPMTRRFDSACRSWRLRSAADSPHAPTPRTSTRSTAPGSSRSRGAAVASGTIVVRNGLIEAVGADVQPPADAVVIDGAGSTVYPGLIDMGTSVGLDIDLVHPAAVDDPNVRRGGTLEARPGPAGRCYGGGARQG